MFSCLCYLYHSHLGVYHSFSWLLQYPPKLCHTSAFKILKSHSSYVYIYISFIDLNPWSWFSLMQKIRCFLLVQNKVWISQSQTQVRSAPFSSSVSSSGCIPTQNVSPVIANFFGEPLENFNFLPPRCKIFRRNQICANALCLSHCSYPECNTDCFWINIGRTNQWMDPAKPMPFLSSALFQDLSLFPLNCLLISLN